MTTPSSPTSPPSPLPPHMPQREMRPTRPYRYEQVVWVMAPPDAVGASAWERGAIRVLSSLQRRPGFMMWRISVSYRNSPASDAQCSEVLADFAMFGALEDHEIKRLALSELERPAFARHFIINVAAV